MLSKFQAIQQQRLDELIQQQNSLYQALNHQQQQLQELSQYQASLSSSVQGLGHLGVANNLAMKKHLQVMIDTLAQKVALAQADLTRMGELVRQQLCQIKSIEVVVNKRLAVKELQQEAEEQAVLDDLALQAYLRRE